MDNKLKWEFDIGDTKWKAKSELGKNGGKFDYVIVIDEEGRFDLSGSDDETGARGMYLTLDSAKDCCQKAEDAAIESAKAESPSLESEARQTTRRWLKDANAAMSKHGLRFVMTSEPDKFRIIREHPQPERGPTYGERASNQNEDVGISEYDAESETFRTTESRMIVVADSAAALLHADVMEIVQAWFDGKTGSVIKMMDALSALLPGNK